MLLPVVRLKIPRHSRHPWIYRKMLQLPRGVELVAGSLVEVRDRDGGRVGEAFYHPDNTIAIRLLTSHPDEKVDSLFLRRRLSYARDLREGILRLPETTDSWRLVNAEADLLPGLVVDKYADVLLIQPFSAGWLYLMDWLVDGLRELYPASRPVVRADPGAAQKEGVSFAKLEAQYPPPDRVVISENNVRYQVDFQSGHKTGFFLDQRDSRSRVGSLARGRRVLDLFSYSGGFSLAAWRGGATAITAVDLDEKALAVAKENASLNQAGEAIRFRHQDAFMVLREVAGKGGRRDFDFIVLDPPKLARGKEEVEEALKSYRDLNRLAANALPAGGLLLSSSCSGAVSLERWRQAVRQGVAEAGRGLTVFLEAGPGADHPVAGDFPQGRYLKTLFARIE
ncbi:MAG: class I SAM-dependent rRNA methyltransferase [Planctomycetota bacterium]|jgi:23S rRNA (cytosine1962-C5)-methyltransferase|nr:class I SAM-dependent rRNA methyltransferase [Planctomycetota bacterium]